MNFRRHPHFYIVLVVIYYIASDHVCEGVYEEYKIMEYCDGEIDLTEDSTIAGKILLSSSNNQRNCTAKVEPWFAWKKIAFEVKEYSLEDGACILVDQGLFSWTGKVKSIEPLFHVCQRGPDTEVTYNRSSTNSSQTLLVTFIPGAQGRSSFILRFFGFQDAQISTWVEPPTFCKPAGRLFHMKNPDPDRVHTHRNEELSDFPCDKGIVCDEDKCLTTVLMCKGGHLFGDCAAKTTCEGPKKAKEKEFKLSVSHILSIISACLALPSIIYIVCRICKHKCCSESDDLPPEDHDMEGESMRLHTEEPVPSAPDMPMNAPPPSYDEVVMDDKYKK